MTRPWKILISLLGGIVIFGLIAAVLHETEPHYHGRSLSHWIKISRATGTTAEQRQEAADAIRYMGNKALPLLLTWATASPSKLQTATRDFLLRYPSVIVPQRFRKWANNPYDPTREYEAKVAFLILGPEAAPAIPELVRIANDVPPGRHAFWAITALGDMGWRAVPALVKTLTNTNAETRQSALHTLSKLGTNALPAVPSIIGLLNDPQPAVKESAAAALGELSLCPQVSIPALMQRLQNPDPQVRFRAACAMVKFGDAVRVAIPELQNVVSNETEPFRKEYLLLSISKIAPATTTNVPP